MMPSIPFITHTLNGLAGIRPATTITHLEKEFDDQVLKESW